ncbi:hypothetical protein O6H91_02G139000 [Diphasiastrum complanatum]|uniref:Uncharacterized protein n=1 Tax=Diphasiastrum complanatum TaxID=34168 RepID=A0ACC2EL69_DIPCM|nr:hypothetical protein O6H91_02G139000 [Diphasiastrum complanatum]
MAESRPVSISSYRLNEDEKPDSLKFNCMPDRLIEQEEHVRREYTFGGPDRSILQARLLKDGRPFMQKVVDGFVNQFFPVGYPYSVGEGYLVYSQFRVLQHFSSAVLSVLSTQSLLFAAGLKPTPAQATVVSWVLKDGMQHIGKLIGSRMGVRMDAEPKRWRIFGAGLEVVSPLCPQYFLEVAGLANLAKGVALVTARATRLPIYSAFAKEGNLSDLYAKGEAVSTVANVLGLGVGIHLASNFCASMQGKLLVSPLLSAVHLYSVVEEMRAAPVDSLNAQKTGMLVADYLKNGSIPRPAELRYRERLILPAKLYPDAGNVRAGGSLRRILRKPSHLEQLKRKFENEKFLLNFNDNTTDLLMHQSASGEDVIRGWLLAACVTKLAGKEVDSQIISSSTSKVASQKQDVLDRAYELMESLLPSLLNGLKEKGWRTHLFLEGSGTRAMW